MARAFLDDDVLLGGDTARILYHGVAAGLPVVDFHSHLPAADLAADRVFASLTDLWLDDDHYKWRAMRLAGVPEHLVTGPADPWERFAAWAATVPRLVRNPLHLWTHLELRRVFGIDLLLGPGTAREIWDEANRQLPSWSARRLLAHFGVRVVATTDDPADDLAAHRVLAAAGPPDDPAPAVVPTFRPDAAHRLAGDAGAWTGWADRVGAAAGIAVTDLASLLEALEAAHHRFAAAGCRASDHGLASVPDVPRDPALADATVRALHRGEPAGMPGRDALALEVVTQSARLAAAGGTVLQLHLGAQRDASPRLLARRGADAGADVMGDARQVPGLVRLLAGLEEAGTLPRCVVTNLNPADNAACASVVGAFTGDGVAGLVQWGPPWWFNDHEAGLRRHLDDLSHLGLLAGFVGMCTDARSLLSMTRHELFRRVLCDVVGRDVDEGRVPDDPEACADLVVAVCGGNASAHFGWAGPAGGGG
ncbi:MAG: glucuronate isomerase [Actinomycetota bacterium]|jgi:glucuronate isomerase|nr:glucuronate isomerase [Actinomycetota bacterium]